MSTWTSPITFSAGAVLTAAQMNTEVRDHLNFLKGALDLITASTTADTGAATLMQINRGSSSVQAYGAAVTGDSNSRYVVLASGQVEWGDGTAARDTNLYRTAANNLKTDDTLTVGASLAIDPVGFMTFGEITAPGAAGTNSCRLFAVDNGAGKTRLSVIFPTGAAITIATEA